MSHINNCPTCGKKSKFCVCSVVAPLQLSTRILILRHPQESDKDLGTASLLNLILPNSTLKTGLSWRNLSHALGTQEENPKSWLVLFLGSAKDFAAASQSKDPLVVVDKKGKPIANSSSVLKGIKGLILIDGNWSQSKAIWWRNSWLLKCHRGILNPPQRSLYGNLRKEPRRESLSTLESAYMAISVIEPNDQLESALLGPFRSMLQQAKQPHPKT